MEWQMKGEKRGAVWSRARAGGSGRRIAAHPCVNVTAVLAGALSNLLPPTTKQLLRLPRRRDHPHGGRCPLPDRGVPSVSARRPPPGAGRSAGGYVQVPPGLRGHRRREPWLGAAWETRLDALPDASDAGSDRSPEHLPGHHRHTLRWNPWVPNIQFVYTGWNDWQPVMSLTQTPELCSPWREVHYVHFNKPLTSSDEGMKAGVRKMKWLSELPLTEPAGK